MCVWLPTSSCNHSSSHLRFKQHPRLNFSCFNLQLVSANSPLLLLCKHFPVNNISTFSLLFICLMLSSLGLAIVIPPFNSFPLHFELVPYFFKFASPYLITLCIPNPPLLDFFSFHLTFHFLFQHKFFPIFFPTSK